MAVNGHSLLKLAPIVNMFNVKTRFAGVSFGLSEVGYDICCKQEIIFDPKCWFGPKIIRTDRHEGIKQLRGRFILASAQEQFDMPNNLVGIVHDKSTWARQGVSVFNTVIEPGWKGFLTLEIVFHGQEQVIIPAGAGIAQVVFHELSETAEYRGKYQNQADKPVESIFA